MNKFRIILLSLGWVFVVPMAFGQLKVVESSSKRVPVWFGGAQTDYIITSARNVDLESAKRQCMDNVRREIIESVAQNISSTSQMSTDQQTTQQGIVQFLERFSSQSATQAATLPFLKGISSTKITEFYWQKVVNKKSGETYYDYSIQYPFSASELRRLMSEFDALDKQMLGQLGELTRGVATIESVAQIESAILALDNLAEYFFDPVRRGQAFNLQQRYRKCYDGISFQTLDSQLGVGRYRLLLDNRAITVAHKPIIRANCATQVEVNFSPSDSCYVVRYNYDGCLEGEDNCIELIYRFGAKQVKGIIYFDIKN